MFDDARSVWELIERRAVASPDRVMLYDGDRTTTFAEYRSARRAGGGRVARARRRCRHERVVATADLDRIRSARRRTVPARCGAEPDAADLPLPRGVVHRGADRLQAAHHADDVEQLRLRRRSPSRSRARSTACTRSSPITGTPTAIPRHCRPPRPGTTIPPTIPCAGSSTRRERRPSRRARATPTDRCSPGRSGTRRRRTSSKTTSRSSRSRSRTSAASSSASSRRCSPGRPPC